MHDEKLIAECEARADALDDSELLSVFLGLVRARNRAAEYAILREAGASVFGIGATGFPTYNHDYLLDEYRPEQLIACLRSAARRADARPIPILEDLVLHRPILSGDEQMIQLAQEALNTVRERVSFDQRSGTLLRPSDEPEAELLVRPANRTAMDTPESLLRPETREPR